MNFLHGVVEEWWEVFFCTFYLVNVIDKMEHYIYIDIKSNFYPNFMSTCMCDVFVLLLIYCMHLSINNSCYQMIYFFRNLFKYKNLIKNNIKILDKYLTQVRTVMEPDALLGFYSLVHGGFSWTWVPRAAKWHPSYFHVFWPYVKSIIMRKFKISATSRPNIFFL